MLSIKSAYYEIKSVKWLSVQDTLRACGLVLLIVLCCATFFALVDFGIFVLLHRFFGYSNV